MKMRRRKARARITAVRPCLRLSGKTISLLLAEYKRACEGPSLVWPTFHPPRDVTLLQQWNAADRMISDRLADVPELYRLGPLTKEQNETWGRLFDAQVARKAGEEGGR